VHFSTNESNESNESKSPRAFENLKASIRN